MFEGTLMEMVITTVGVLLTMALLSCLCCLCMKFSDLKLKGYIIETAKSKGVKVDLDQIESKYSSRCEHTKENCTIIIPDYAVVI